MYIWIRCSVLRLFYTYPRWNKNRDNKWKAIKVIKSYYPKTILSFVGQSNFFRTHIKNFAVIALPLLQLSRKDYIYRCDKLPHDAIDTFPLLK